MANSTKAEIDLRAIAQNVRTVKGLIGEKCHLLAVVKADGYGHGALEVGRVALENGATWLGVANPIEGQILREGGIKGPILVLLPIEPQEAKIVAEYDLCQTVENPGALEVLDREAQKAGKRIKVHLKVDTGMNRLGVRCEKALKVAREIFNFKSLELEGVFSHFATADENDQSFARFQLEKFQSFLREMEEEGIPVPLKHMANSAATINIPESWFDMVRVGILIYGLPPSNEVPCNLPLKPAMTLKTKVMSIKDVEEGEGISYGREFIARRRMRIGIIPLGYGNGYSRLFSNQSYFLFRGKRVPQVGRVCMDMCAIDLSEFDDPRPGEEVVVFGEDLTATEVGDYIGTINYEILCVMGKSVPRYYIGKNY
ncbi:MAG: alanine racemase [Caldiserica bacterium]|jgi:alanine racemase|nr:alanine racemase [Caldisericota bacterium]MDH7562006.1 alanine racemase [Caldisericota bacterium]